MERAVWQVAEASSGLGHRPAAQSSSQVPDALTTAEALLGHPQTVPDSGLQQLCEMVHVVCFQPREGKICCTTDS